MAASPELPYPCPCMHCGHQCTEADRRNHPHECRACVRYYARALWLWRMGYHDPEIDLMMLGDERNIN